jgi:hypothetical protein
MKKKTNCLYFAHGTPFDQTSWLETIADVEVIPSSNGLFSIENLELLLEKYKERPFKIASITSFLLRNQNAVS